MFKNPALLFSFLFAFNDDGAISSTLLTKAPAYDLGAGVIFVVIILCQILKQRIVARIQLMTRPIEIRYPSLVMGRPKLEFSPINPRRLRSVYF